MHASDMKRENAAVGMLFEEEANVNRMFLMISAIWKQRIGAIWCTFNPISLSAWFLIWVFQFNTHRVTGSINLGKNLAMLRGRKNN